MKESTPKFAFAKDIDVDVSGLNIPNIDELYRKSLNTREGMRDVLQNAIDAALENLMSWERMAHANGFEVEFVTDCGLGNPVPHFEDGKVSFIQRYGAIVKEKKENNR